MEKFEMRKSWIRNESGFTLVESMITVSIIGILAATFIVYEIAMRPTRNMHAYGRDMLANIQLARLEAVKRNACIGITYDIPNQQYWVFTDDGTGLGIACDSVMHNDERDNFQFPARRYPVPQGVTLAVSPVVATVADPNFTPGVGTDLFDSITITPRALIGTSIFGGSAVVLMNGPNAANTTWWGRVIVNSMGGNMQYQTNDNPATENRWSE